MTDVLKEIESCHATVISICSYNAKAIKSAFQKNKFGILWESCAAHTADLSIKDMFKTDKKYGFVFNSIN